MVRAAALVPAHRVPGSEPQAWRLERKMEVHRSGSARCADAGWEAGRSEQVLGP